MIINKNLELLLYVHSYRKIDIVSFTEGFFHFKFLFYSENASLKVNS